MIDLTKAKEAAMFSETYTADPDHDYFIGPEVPVDEAWELNTLWLRVGEQGVAEAMIGVVDDDKFICLASRVNLMRGDSISWSGSVLLESGHQVLYRTTGARQDCEVACSATWRVLSVVKSPRGKSTGGGNGSTPTAN